MDKIIVSGSTAYDNIMHSDSNLKDHLSSKDIGKINISYIISKLHREIGGTGLNICYNMALLGTESILFSSVGKDFTFPDIIKENVDLDNVNISNNNLTPISYITNDNYGDQLQAFYPGAMEENIYIKHLKIKDVEYSIVSSNNINCMKSHLKFLFDNGIKTFFDPGQQITQMAKEELKYCFSYSNYIILNEYEYEVIKQRSEKTDGEMIEMFDRMIITYGLRGSKIFDNNYNIIEIAGVENPEFIDPTGSGDAYRAGILKGLNDGYSWETSARIGAVLASISTSSIGAQNHFINWDKFSKLYESTFGESLIK